VYVLKSKDQALDAFVKFKAEAENVTGEKIKALRSDRGENSLQQHSEMFVRKLEFRDT